MSKFLRDGTKQDIKLRFSVAERGWWYNPQEGDPIYLTKEDLNIIHDMVVFQSTKEYLEWFKRQVK